MKEAYPVPLKECVSFRMAEPHFLPTHAYLSRSQPSSPPSAIQQLITSMLAQINLTTPTWRDRSVTKECLNGALVATFRVSWRSELWRMLWFQHALSASKMSRLDRLPALPTIQSSSRRTASFTTLAASYMVKLARMPIRNAFCASSCRTLWVTIAWKWLPVTTSRPSACLKIRQFYKWQAPMTTNQS